MSSTQSRSSFLVDTVGGAFLLLSALCVLYTVLGICLTVASAVLPDNEAPAPVGHPVSTLAQAEGLARASGADPQAIAITRGEDWSVKVRVERDNFGFPGLDHTSRGYCLAADRRSVFLYRLDGSYRAFPGDVGCPTEDRISWRLDEHGVWRREPEPEPPTSPAPGHIQ